MRKGRYIPAEKHILKLAVTGLIFNDRCMQYLCEQTARKKRVFANSNAGIGSYDRIGFAQDLMALQHKCLRWIVSLVPSLTNKVFKTRDYFQFMQFSRIIHNLGSLRTVADLWRCTMSPFILKKCNTGNKRSCILFYSLQQTETQCKWECIAYQATWVSLIDAHMLTSDSIWAWGGAWEEKGVKTAGTKKIYNLKAIVWKRKQKKCKVKSFCVLLILFSGHLDFL